MNDLPSIHPADRPADLQDARIGQLEERVRRLEQHAAAMLDHIVALRRSLDTALDDLARDMAEKDGAAGEPGVRH